MSLSLIEKTDPRRADEIREMAASAIGSPKRVAFALGVSARRGRQMKGGERTSTVSRFFMLLASLPLSGLSPFPLATKVDVVAFQSLVLGMDDNALVKRFWDLMQKEAEHEGEENKVSAMFARNGDLAELAAATEKEAATAKELAAVTRELLKRNLDPRKA
jgi:hypothetical protein